MTDDKRNSMTEVCPACGQPLSSDGAECPCGGTSSLASLAAVVPPQLPSTVSRREAALLDAGNLQLKAHLSWFCPLASWLSQILFALLVPGTPSLRSYALLAVILQFGLLIAGLYFGAKVVSLKRRGIAVEGPDYAAAIVGLVFSGGTVLLVLVLALSTSF